MNHQEPSLNLQQLGAKPHLSARRWWRIVGRIAAATVWVYAGALVCVWLLLRFGGDRWWLATVIMFGPRWFLAVPLPFLAAAAAVFWRRGLWLLLVSLIVLLGPIMDFGIPWRWFGQAHGQKYRVLTCNVGGRDFDEPLLLALIARVQPDFIALQECQDPRALAALGDYHVIHHGELIVASRFPLQLRTELSGAHPPHVYPRLLILSCAADTPHGKITFCSLHLPSARYGLSNVLDKTTGLSPSKSGLLTEQIALRKEQSRAVASIVEALPDPVILAGDFNMPEESSIYRDNWSTYQNAFSRTGFGFGYTFNGAVRGIPFGIRIDHILCTAALHPCRCWVGPDVGSDHLPLVADLTY
jgi:vancomycin resistance protein VanJ